MTAETKQLQIKFLREENGTAIPYYKYADEFQWKHYSTHSEAQPDTWMSKGIPTLMYLKKKYNAIILENIGNA